MAAEYDWQTCMGKLAQRGAFLLKSSWRSDVNFLVGQESCQQSFKAHKLLLAMASPVFEAMLYGGMAENTAQPIQIPDIHPEAFKALLQYIYTDEIVLQAVDKAVELCYAGKKYMLPQLVRQCTQFIWKDLSPNNACRAYEFAKLFDVPFLKDKCIQAFKTYTEEVLKSADFPDISEDTLMAILSLQEMAIQSEKIVFDAVLGWAQQECTRRGIEPSPSNVRKLLGPNLFSVRLFAMSPAEFTSGPGVSGLFNDQEMLAILMNISMPGVKPLPESLQGVKVQPVKRLKCRTRYYCALSYPSSPQAHFRLAQSPVLTELRLFVDRDIFFHGVVFNSQIQYTGGHLVEPSCVEVASPPLSFILPGCESAGSSSSALNGDGELTSANNSVTSAAAATRVDHNTYQENLLLQVCSADCEPLAETRFSKKVRYDEKVEVTLERPYMIRRHTGYVLRVTFGSVGSYKRYTELMGPSETDGIHITCSYVNGFLVAVHTIIFSRAEVPPVEAKTAATTATTVTAVRPPLPAVHTNSTV